jgi:hypothetical protein
MIGTAIRNHPFGMIACAGRSRVRSGPLSASARSSRRRATQPSLSFDVRKVLTAFLVFAVIFGSVICGTAAHQSLEGDIAASVQSVGDVADASDEPAGPAEGSVPGLCTGHCAAHAFGLPALMAQSAVPFVNRAVWLVVDDQWSHASRPARLERPPRV